MKSAISSAGYTPGDDVRLALDCAASEYLSKTASTNWQARGKSLSSEENASYIENLQLPTIRSSPIEDGMHEDDWDGWKILTEKDRRDSASLSATTCS
jgi:enolase